jgi:hypothetical protein
MELKIQDIYQDIYKDSIKPSQNIPNTSNTSNTQIPNIPTQIKQNVTLQKQKIENNKKITSYDNILSSLNMQVVDGKLQIVRTDTKNTNDAKNTKDNAKKVSFQNHTQNPVVQKHTPQQLRQQQLQLQQERIQNYQNRNQNQNQNQNQNNARNLASPWQQEMNINENLAHEEIPIFDEDPNYFPMTKQEIKRMLAIQYLKNMQEKRKIEMLKPKKMNFL